MNIKGIPLFLMFHRIVENKELIMSDYDVESDNFLKLTKLISERNKNYSNESHQLIIIPTFDDGNKSDLECARILNKFRVNAIFFITTNRVNQKGYLTEYDLLEMKSLGHFIGSHTMSHITCPTSKADDVMREFYGSKKYLETLLKYKCEHFAFPGGLYKNRDFLLAKKVEYKYIFNTFEKLPTNLRTDKTISRMHVRQSTLKKFLSIIELKKSYYLIRFFRSCLRNLKYISIKNLSKNNN